MLSLFLHAIALVKQSSQMTAQSSWDESWNADKYFSYKFSFLFIYVRVENNLERVIFKHKASPQEPFRH